jgi:hypothetical protein
MRVSTFSMVRIRFSAIFAALAIADPAVAAPTWTTVGSMASPCEAPAVVLSPDGRVLAATGFANGGFLAGAELHDPASQWLSRAGSFASSGSALASAILLSSGRVLVAGGPDASSTFGTLFSAELLAPASPGWTASLRLATRSVGASSESGPPDAPAPRVLEAASGPIRWRVPEGISVEPWLSLGILAATWGGVDAQLGATLRLGPALLGAFAEGAAFLGVPDRGPGEDLWRGYHTFVAALAGAALDREGSPPELRIPVMLELGLHQVHLREIPRAAGGLPDPAEIDRTAAIPFLGLRLGAGFHGPELPSLGFGIHLFVRRDLETPCLEFSVGCRRVGGWSAGVTGFVALEIPPRARDASRDGL